MRLEPLYRVRFGYPQGWGIGLEGGWEQYFFRVEGRCEGSITGRFHGANFPRRRTGEGPFCPDLRAVIETDDGSTIMVEGHGYGRSYPADRRQIVGSVLHLSDSKRYRYLNDVVSVCVGEVRSPTAPDMELILVMDVAALIWHPSPTNGNRCTASCAGNLWPGRAGLPRPLDMRQVRLHAAMC